MVNLNERYLFVIDLDGTLLSDSANSIISNENIDAVKNLIKKGHVVCIATGRPWRTTKKTYDLLGLDTLVANYNGAQIHNPRDYSFNHNISHMNLNDVLYVMGDKKVKKMISNIAIEGPSWVMLQKRDANFERIFGFTHAKSFKLGINLHKIPLRPTGVIFDTKKGANIKELGDYLQRTYGDLGEFSWWSKGEGLSPVFDMTNVGVNKAKALSLMARYYEIPLDRTISIGDGQNDISMFKVSEISVAMANAHQEVKNFATYLTKKTNKESGVAHFIKKFLAKDSKIFIDKLKELRNEKFIDKF